MYLPTHFADDRPELLASFIATHPFGMLVTVADGHLTANHLPMLVDTTAAGVTRLHGHVARANPVASKVLAGAEVLAVFGDVHHYISPTWYPSKQTDGRVVPTWNYAVVHVRGRIEWFDERERLLALVTRLTARHEAANPQPWSVADAPQSYIDTMLRAIVGFEVAVESTTAKFKSSQNRNAADRAGVVRGLTAEGVPAEALAELVREPRG